MLKKRARKDTESCDSQVMANNCMHFDTLPKHSPVYREKYAAVLSVLIRGFENRFQGCQKKKNHKFIFVTPFSVEINTLPANFQMKCIDLQSDIQLKNVTTSLYKTFIRPLSAENDMPRCANSLIHVTIFWQYAYL